MTFSAGISFLPRISKKPALKQTGLAAVLFVDTRFLRHKGGTILSYKQHWNDSPQETLCGLCFEFITFNVAVEIVCAHRLQTAVQQTSEAVVVLFPFESFPTHSSQIKCTRMEDCLSA